MSCSLIVKDLVPTQSHVSDFIIYSSFLTSIYDKFYLICLVTLLIIALEKIVHIQRKKFSNKLLFSKSRLHGYGELG